MNSKTILKTLAMAMLMPAMLLTTSCSSEDEFVTNTANTENTINKGYALPVTVNVTRQGDGITRATYTDNGNGTGTLGFDTGDQLFILGAEYGDGMPGWFYGTLTWQSGGTFSGTLTTENEYTGTIDAILGSLHAYLLPAGYDSYDFLTVSPGEGWDASVEPDFSKTFADTKAEAIEQFSFELGVHNTLSDCIELEPMMAILNFTISGLTASTEYAVVLNNGTEDISGDVTTDALGNATFAVSVLNGLDSQGLTLTVGGNPVALNLDGANNRTLAKGKIYNITRSAAPVGPTYPSISTVTTSDYGKVVCAAGHLHDANTPVPSGCTGVGVIAKVTDGGHGLIMSLQDADENCWTNIKWCTSVTYAGSTMKRLDDWMLGSLPSYTSLGSIAVSNWCVASMDDYIAMFQNLGSQSSADPKSYDNYVNAKITSAGGTALNDGDYWGYLCATEGWSFYYYSWDGDSERNDPIYDKYVRPVLGF